MIVDLHNHTPLCNHAEGKLSEYIEQAIKNGTKYFGFSDHAPMSFDPTYRMNLGQMAPYENEILELKERYKDKIEILLGYEVDYLPKYHEPKVLNADVDFLIGSIHFLDHWGFDNPEFIKEYHNKDIDDIWREYFYQIEQMAKSGLFDVVGHIDLIKVFKFMPKIDIKSLAQNALKAIKKSNMVVEINSAGWRKPIGEAYPSQQILELCQELDIDITLGSDAHKPSQVGLNSEKTLNLAKKTGYNRCVIFKKRDREFINLDI